MNFVADFFSPGVTVKCKIQRVKIYKKIKMLALKLGNCVRKYFTVKKSSVQHTLLKKLTLRDRK